MLNFLKNLQNQRETEEERIKELVKTRTMLEGKIAQLNWQVNNMAQLSADAQAQYDAKLESLRLVDSGFNALEEIGYERYVPTMESDNYFNDKRVAPDREFFYITPQEAIDVLKNKFKQEVHFEEENMEDIV